MTKASTPLTYNQLRSIATYTHYDYMFKIAAYQYFGGDNEWAIRLKAQGIAESALTMTENSATKACGVMQLMPSTFEWLTMGRLDIHDAYANISIGAALMAWLMGQRIIIKDKNGKVVGAQLDGFCPLKKIEDEYERWKFALAGYNCGIGHITGTRDGRCCWDIVKERNQDITKWDNCKGVLVHITGMSNARETITYVDRILHYATLMRDAGEQIV